MELKIEIVMTPNGMQVNAPQDIIVTLGMLELAKNTLIRAKQEQQSKHVHVAPASVLELMKDKVS